MPSTMLVGVFRETAAGAADRPGDLSDTVVHELVGGAGRFADDADDLVEMDAELRDGDD